MPSLGKPEEILSAGRTQPEVRKYLHLLLLGRQPGPSRSPRPANGLQELTGVLQQPREGPEQFRALGSSLPFGTAIGTGGGT